MSIRSNKGEPIPHFKIDGTNHEQHGKQMEGRGWMTKSEGVQIYAFAPQTVLIERLPILGPQVRLFRTAGVDWPRTKTANVGKDWIAEG